jgi:hypothetical protein
LRRKVSRFEAMNGNRIGTGAQLECKGMRRPFENTVWTGVGRGQWGLVRRGTDKNKGGMEQTRRNGGWGRRI